MMIQKIKNNVMAAVAVLVLAAMFFAGCTIKPAGQGEESSIDSSGTLQVTVKLVSTETTILDQQMSYDGEVTAGRAVKDACQRRNMAYVVEDGLYSSFNGIASTQTDGWLFYLNDQLPDRGADDVTLSAGDVVEFRYVNYDEAFAQ
jgi:hypothetical protein